MSHDHKHEHNHDHGRTHDHESVHNHSHNHDDHLLDEYDGPIEEHPLWQRDNVILRSVGIDVGSSGTQILFSELHLRRQGSDLSSRFLVVARHTWYVSPVSLTPYSSETLIDDRALGEIVDKAYHAARVHPDDIDTGAVILTGEALRRENSERIARILSEKCGDLVCVTAGHHMEAMLAANGSGAVQASYDRNERIINIDIGGGTTKLSVIEKGKILSTAAIHIGGRLLAVDENGRIERLEPAGQAHARRAGFSWQTGDAVTDAELDAVAASMANDLIKALTMPILPENIMQLYLTDPVTNLESISSMIFSGGVAEYVYDRESRDFGDLGKRLGASLRKRIEAGELPWALLSDSEGIRSTALGASEYTAQLSGNTGYLSDQTKLLPRRNLRVLQPVIDFSAELTADKIAGAISQHLLMFDVDGAEDRVLAFHWQGSPDYARIAALAAGILGGMPEWIQQGKPLYVILDADIAMTLGAILKEDLSVANELLVIDGIALWDFDYIDIGKMRMPSATVPVTIKSLVFNDTTAGKGKQERIHDNPEEWGSIVKT
jgi:ethanolamine utilization protein EutA